MSTAPIISLASSAPNSGFVVGLLVILGAAAFMSIFLRRLHLASIPGYLIIGAIIGAANIIPPSATGEASGVGQISDLAIVLLMFTIGMHMDVEAIRGGMVRILAVGAGSTTAAILIGWPVAIALGLSAPAALATSMALAMSSTAVVLGLLNARREVHRVHGRLCVGIALTQDLMSIGILAILPLLALWATGRPAGPEPAIIHQAAGDLPGWVDKLARAMLALGGITLMVWFGRVLLPRMLREAGRDGNTEALLVVSAAAALGAAVLTNVLGFGSPLGAFLAGFLLSSTQFRSQLAGQLSPMRDLFMAVFFTAVGVEMNLGAALSHWWIILLGLMALMTLKASIIGFSCWAGGATAPAAALTGVLLCQGGEFSLVVLQEAQGKGIVSADAQSVVVAIVVLSLIATTPLSDTLRPYLGRLARIRPARGITSPAFRDPHEQARPAVHAAAGDSLNGTAPDVSAVPSGPPKKPRVIIAGFGVVGRNIGEHLAAYGMDYTIVEMNPRTVERQGKLGRAGVFGDISNSDVLESAGIEDADAVILTIPDDDATLRAIRTIRERRPDVYIAARTTYLSQAITATEHGADHITVEEVVTAQDMATKVVNQLGKRLVKPATPHL